MTASYYGETYFTGNVFILINIKLKWNRKHQRGNFFKHFLTTVLCIFKEKSNFIITKLYYIIWNMNLPVFFKQFRFVFSNKQVNSFFPKLFCTNFSHVPHRDIVKHNTLGKSDLWSWPSVGSPTNWSEFYQNCVIKCYITIHEIPKNDLVTYVIQGDNF